MAENSRWQRTTLGLASLATLAAAAISCGGGGGGGATSTNMLNLDVCNPDAGPFSLNVTNRFFPLPVGRDLVLEGAEDGGAVRLVITVTAQPEVVAGVPTRMVEERETIDGELSEVSRNFFVQAPDGTVCYFGEDVDFYENGVIANHEGQWRAGVGGALPGIQMPPDPQPGDFYAQERAPGVAEDRARVVSLGDTINVPAGTFQDTLTNFEDSTLESSTGTKSYVSGIGLVKDGAIELTSFK